METSQDANEMKTKFKEADDKLFSFELQVQTMTKEDEKFRSGLKTGLFIAGIVLVATAGPAGAIAGPLIAGSVGAVVGGALGGVGAIGASLSAISTSINATSPLKSVRVSVAKLRFHLDKQGELIQK